MKMKQLYAPKGSMTNTFISYTVRLKHEKMKLQKAEADQIGCSLQHLYLKCVRSSGYKTLLYKVSHVAIENIIGQSNPAPLETPMKSLSEYYKNKNYNCKYINGVIEVVLSNTENWRKRAKIQ